MANAVQWADLAALFATSSAVMPCSTHQLCSSALCLDSSPLGIALEAVRQEIQNFGNLLVYFGDTSRPSRCFCTDLCLRLFSSCSFERILVKSGWDVGANSKNNHRTASHW